MDDKTNHNDHGSSPVPAAAVRARILSIRTLAVGWRETIGEETCTRSDGHWRNGVMAQWANDAAGEAACFSHQDEAGVFLTSDEQDALREFNRDVAAHATGARMHGAHHVNTLHVGDVVFVEAFDDPEHGEYTVVSYDAEANRITLAPRGAQ